MTSCLVGETPRSFLRLSSWMISGTCAIGFVSHETLFFRVPKRMDKHNLRLSNWMTGASHMRMHCKVRCYIVSGSFVFTLASCKPGFGFSYEKEAEMSWASCLSLRYVGTSRA